VTRERVRRLIPGAAAILLATSFAVIAQANVSAADADEVAARYHFHELPIDFPPGYESQRMRSVRDVNPAFHKIRGWVSAMGAGIAVNDLTGSGRADGMCIVDTRTDDVVVTYTPTARAEDRFTPFVLDPAPLPMDDAMAPMGCVPGDYNGDSRTDLLVYYWGRTPVLFLAKAGATTVANDSYRTQELVPQTSVDGRYHGPRWNTSAVNVDDYDGDGHPDLYVGNYFADSDVLDPRGPNNVQMPNSLSSATNGGGGHVLRWYGATAGAEPTVDYVAEEDAVPFGASNGWTLGVASADLTGDGLPSLYVATDFGHQHMLHNVSTKDHIRFVVVKGERTPTTPKSFVLGNASFKGMGVDFGDLNRNGSFDAVVSNISVAFGIEESNLLWINKAADQRDMKSKLDSGIAPFTQEAQEHGMAWTGWGWDVKMADFLNSGDLEVVQALGFLKGVTNRWAWIQELAMNNDLLVGSAAMWPNVQPGDDISGSEPLAFFGKASDGTWVNVSDKVGLGAPTPSRGVAMGDTTGTGVLDLAVARQWGPPAFYRNEAPEHGDYLNLKLYRPGADAGTGLASLGSPAYGATVTVTTADGRTQVSRMDGGSGHSGKRSFDVHFGLGAASGPATVHLQWRDTDGTEHQQTQQFEPGTHTLLLGGAVQEVANR
jgi:hypothetical protein